jgi:hypothetical protein
LCWQVYEVSNELVEAREELELLRLQLEMAEEEREAARCSLAASQSALAAALEMPMEPLTAESDHDEVGLHADTQCMSCMTATGI